MHHSKVLKKLYQIISVFFSPAYSPFLNPIEELFAHIKFKLRYIHKSNVA